MFCINRAKECLESVGYRYDFNIVIVLVCYFCCCCWWW